MPNPLFHRRALALLLAFIVGPALAEPALYLLDPLHTRIVLRVGHNGFSSVMGSFSQPQGELWFDPDNWQASRVEVRIDLHTLDLGDEGFNARILRRNWLDATRHPQARFVSHRIEPLGENQARVHGSLALRGIEVPVVLDMKLNRLARSPYNGMRRTAGFSGTATLSRAALGMKAYPKAVDDTVHLLIEAEAIRGRTPNDSGPRSDSVHPQDTDHDTTEDEDGRA